MLPVSPTWEIYERWCFLRLTEVLRRLFPTLSWKRRTVAGTIDRILDTGTADGITVTVYLQKRFPAMDKKKDNARFYSISGERRPDIVVTYMSVKRQHCVVFDPKYSVSRTSVLAAMETAHLYRDCLRWNNRAPDLVLLLIPASGEANWLEEQTYHSTHRVGVLPLSPASGTEQLQLMLRQLLLD
nr:nuclease domain-containing protein [Janthinobacterium sp. NKUCC06_STL]